MDQSIKKKYNYWQWRTLIILMIGYALFYFVRKNFSIAMPALKSELGLDETQLGIFLTLNGIVYGVSRFINGFGAVPGCPGQILRSGHFTGNNFLSALRPAAKPLSVWCISLVLCGLSMVSRKGWAILPAVV